MMSSPLISVVIPAWNCAHIITAVLDALYPQCLKIQAIELILINDFSQDKTGDVLEQYKKEHSDLSMTIVHQTTVGSSARSRNCGIKQARAPLILFLDADIVTEPNVIEQHLQMHQQYDDLHTVILGQVASPKEWQATALDIVCNPSQEWDSINKGAVSWDHFFTGHISAHKQFLESVNGFDERYLRCEDIELGSRLSTEGMHLYYLASAVGYHYHRRSVSQECRNNTTYAQMFAYFYRYGSPEMQAHVNASWFMEKNSRVQIKQVLGFLLANCFSQPLTLFIADKLSNKIPLISQFIWRIVFFHIGYQTFQQSLKQETLNVQQHPDHQKIDS